MTPLLRLVSVVVTLAIAPSVARADLFVSSFQTDQVLRYSANTGKPIGDGVFVAANSAGLVHPAGLAFGPDGNLYVASLATDQVLVYNGQTGKPVGNGVFVTQGNNAGLDTPRGLVFGPDRNLYVASEANDQILEYDGKTGKPVGDGVFVAQGSAGLVNPSGLAFLTTAKLFVSNDGIAFGVGQVQLYDGTTGKPVGNGVIVPQKAAGLNDPFGLAIGPGDGNLYVTSAMNNTVLVFDPITGKPVGNGVFVTQGNNAGLNTPLFLTFSSPIIASVPEPSSIALLLLGLSGLIGYYRCRLRR